MSAFRHYHGKTVIGGICAIVVVLGISMMFKLVNAHSATSWSRVWSENFTGPAGSGVNPAYWTYSTGRDQTNGSVETLTDAPSNVHLDGAGDLDITSFYRGTGWYSGRIQSKTLYGAPAGGELEVSASIKQPAPADGLGYWPAFWLLGQGSWPEHGEIDILEDVNALSQHSAALHCGNLTVPNSDGTYGPCHEHTGLSSGMLPCPSCQEGYHTYSVIVDRRNPAAESVTWYLDGQQFYRVAESQVGAQVWGAAVDHGFTVIFDLAIGGSFPDTRCRCTTPTSQTTSDGTMSVRNISVYES